MLLKNQRNTKERRREHWNHRTAVWSEPRGIEMLLQPGVHFPDPHMNTRQVAATRWLMRSLGQCCIVSGNCIQMGHEAVAFCRPDGLHPAQSPPPLLDSFLLLASAKIRPTQQRTRQTLQILPQFAYLCFHTVVLPCDICK